jgi:ferredoxin--NADP+ reductase
LTFGVKNVNIIIIFCEVMTMYKIIKKRKLNDTVTFMSILAPFVAKKARAGQFIILRVDEDGERIPLTVAGYDRDEGTVDIIFQIVGATTKLLDAKEEGEFITDFAGPLGLATETEGIKSVLIVGGGVGCAIALPVARAFKELGASVSSVIGFRNKELVILEDEFRDASDELTVMTDDGSYSRQGNVCVPINEMLSMGKRFDRVITIGPLVMMKFVVEAVRPYGIPCTVSMNPIMIDGTGMCGGCRLTLNKDGQRVTKFACVDGPDFDGYEVDFDEAISRGSMYRDFERHAYESTCNLLNKE